MGIFGNVFNRDRSVAPPSDPSSTLGRSDTLPAAPDSVGGKLAAGGNAALDKATQIYKQNPKLVAGLAAVAGAIILTRMKRPRA
jgi:hypothetical protein